MKNAAKESPAKMSPQNAKELGNKLFKENKIDEAIAAYREGLENEIDDVEVHVALCSNLAMLLLKREKWAEAHELCDMVLKTLTKSNRKVWYRRALAREGLRLNHEAADDLEACLKLFPEEKDRTAAESSMFRTVTAARVRILSKMAAASTPAPMINGNGSHVISRPDPREQRQAVARLLMTRQLLLERNPPSDGESFYLVDWEWWRQWCSYVDFFNLESSQNSIGKEQLKLLKLLPEGRASVVPLRWGNESDDEDEDMTTLDPQPPGPMDHSRLFQKTNDQFRRQWRDSTKQLEPNLVRGHHYEVLPREVYHALSHWYKCTSPCIIRWTTDGGVLSLYNDPESETKEDKMDDDTIDNMCGACGSKGACCRCKQCMGIHYCDRTCQESHWPYHKIHCKKLAAAGPRDDGVIPLAMRPPRNHRVGLYNLGNTCFMNSALQCLTHATPLTRHFLSNKYKQDLNLKNPLGTQGRLAHAYDTVVKDLWLKSHEAASPTALKRAIAMFAQRFAGTSQHDAQEFLAYLLDGLHEDLNRIRKAPYVEMPDVSEDDNMHIAGVEAWEAYQRRNDSLVMDTFYGQFKSTCVCPRCKRTSTSFDAFNHVSLEIPQPKNLPRFVSVLVMDPSPTRYLLQVPRGGLVGDLQQAVSRASKIPANRITLCDVYENSIYEILDRTKKMSSIRQNDVIVAYSVDPYENQFIHVVATNAFWVKQSVETENGKQEQMVVEKFGFPFLASFDVESTCRQVWEHLWDQVSCYVDDDKRDLLSVRLVDTSNKFRAAFPTSEGDEDMASIIPREDDNLLAKYLGEGCADAFLFVALEWNKKGTKLEVGKKAFSEFTDHPSFATELEKQKKASQNMRSVSLDQCLETFTRPERLDENNMWYCNKCKEHVQAMKTMELWRLPNILVVHLKRFEFKNTFRRDKLETFVDCPQEGLDMARHCASYKGRRNSFIVDKIPAEYDLFGVINHYGRLGFGHYTAFARRFDEDGVSSPWYLFDDAGVQNVGDGKATRMGSIVTPAAYVLFYRRRTFT